MRVLQVEDDAIAARGIELLMKSIGASIDTAATGEDALEFLQCGEYDILIVDLRLPDMSGHDLVRKMRRQHIDTPVLMLTGFAAMPDKMAAFAVGVDDFISKPVENAELVARLRAIVRRNHGHTRSLLSAGTLVLDQDAQDVSVAGRPVHLTRKEYALLELLMLRQGRVVAKSTIMDHLYGGLDEPEIRTIDVFLCYLRKKLAKEGAGDLIRTVQGAGYRIDAPPATITQPATMREMALA